MNIEDVVMAHATDLVERGETPLRDAKTCGRYANVVRIREGAYGGRKGVVAKIVSGTPFVRFPNGVTLPFGVCELEVLR